jgi:hypothetical protein
MITTIQKSMRRIAVTLMWAMLPGCSAAHRATAADNSAASSATSICRRDPTRPGCDTPRPVDAIDKTRTTAEERSPVNGFLDVIGGALKGAFGGAAAGFWVCPVVVLPTCAGAIAVGTTIGAVAGARKGAQGGAPKRAAPVVEKPDAIALPDREPAEQDEQP